jgi:DNA mismatch repair protein MSH6
MDELGRGTSTFDGTAIASASVKHLIERNQCLSLFATHYHSLLDEWQDSPHVLLGHMECLVNETIDSFTSGKSDEITFLYTLGEGACPRSFGINVARLARLPENVLSTAKRISKEFEDNMQKEGQQESDDASIARARDAKKRIVMGSKSRDLIAIGDIWEQLQAP